MHLVVQQNGVGVLGWTVKVRKLSGFFQAGAFAVTGDSTQMLKINIVVGDVAMRIFSEGKNFIQKIPVTLDRLLTTLLTHALFHYAAPD